MLPLHAWTKRCTGPLRHRVRHNTRSGSYDCCSLSPHRSAQTVLKFRNSEASMKSQLEVHPDIHPLQMRKGCSHLSA